MAMSHESTMSCVTRIPRRMIVSAIARPNVTAPWRCTGFDHQEARPCRYKRESPTLLGRCDTGEALLRVVGDGAVRVVGCCALRAASVQRRSADAGACAGGP